MKSISRYFLALILGYGILCISSISFAQTAKLWQIEMSFCNNNQRSNEIDYITKAGVNTPICIQFTNQADHQNTINVEFTDAIITDDNFKNRACNAPDRQKVHFANFINDYNHTIVLQSWQTINKDFMIRYPVGFKWLSHWCIMYNMIENDEQVSEGLFSAFNVIVRSAKFIDFFVSDIQAKQSLYITQSPKIKKNWDEYQISLWITNKGNIEEKIHMVNVLSNIFGYQEDTAIDAIIPADTWMIFTSPAFILPVYGWPFRLTTKITYVPEFNFNITNGKEPSGIYDGGTKKIQTVVFVRTRQFWAAIAILLLFVYGIIRKWIFEMKNKIRIQKNNSSKNKDSSKTPNSPII